MCLHENVRTLRAVARSVGEQYCLLDVFCATLQSLWQVRNFAVGNRSLVAEFLCVLTGLSGQIGDIAVLLDGTFVVSCQGFLPEIPGRPVNPTETSPDSRRVWMPERHHAVHTLRHVTSCTWAIHSCPGA